MTPAWLKLIEQWRDEVHFGLTIPFLLGALRQWPNNPLGASADELEELRNLLTSVRDDTPEAVIMRLYPCDGLDQKLILAPVSQVQPDYLAIPSPSRTAPALYVHNNIIPEISDPFDTLVNEMWRRFGQDISTGNFSFHNGAYHPFTVSERELINKAINRIHEDDD